ncbi:MAG: DUF1565 domain-containing protein [Candidatus Hodarchaeales archaeon]
MLLGSIKIALYEQSSPDKSKLYVSVSSQFGFYLLQSHINTLTTNTATINDYGFLLDGSNNNQLYDNILIDNDFYDLYEANCLSNDIRHNNPLPPPETITESITETEPASTITTIVPDTTTNTVIITSINTGTTIETTIETSISTIISQIVESITKTTEGFSIVFITIAMLGLLIIRRKRQG